MLTYSIVRCSHKPHCSIAGCSHGWTTCYENCAMMVYVEQCASQQCTLQQCALQQCASQCVSRQCASQCASVVRIVVLALCVTQYCVRRSLCVVEGCGAVCVSRHVHRVYNVCVADSLSTGHTMCVSQTVSQCVWWSC